MDFNRLDSIHEFYERSLASYELVVTEITSGRIALPLIPSVFTGLTFPELNQVLGEMKQELDREVVMATVAIAENEIRLHYERHGRKHITAFKRVYAKYKARARLEDLLDEWKTLLAKPRVVSAFKQVLSQRHWLAHGRSPRRRPQEFTPVEAQEKIRDLLEAIGSHP